MTRSFNSRSPEFSTHQELIVKLRSLLKRVATLESENADLKKENALLKAENALLKAENLRLQEEVCASKRPTAPFSKGTGKANPKKPGRKPGQGNFVRRAEPAPGPVRCVKLRFCLLRRLCGNDFAFFEPLMAVGSPVGTTGSMGGVAPFGRSGLGRWWWRKRNGRCGPWRRISI